MLSGELESWLRGRYRREKGLYRLFGVQLGQGLCFGRESSYVLGQANQFVAWGGLPAEIDSRTNILLCLGLDVEGPLYLLYRLEDNS